MRKFIFLFAALVTIAVAGCCSYELNSDGTRYGQDCLGFTQLFGSSGCENK